MTNDRAKAIRKRAMRALSIKGVDHDTCEDLAQDVLCKYAAGLGKHQTVDQAVIDALRAQLGDPRKPGHSKRRDLLKTLRLTASENGHTSIANEAGNQFHSLMGKLKGMERATLCLTHLWGFDVYEIAYCYGVSPGRISQIKNAAHARLEKHVR